MSGFADLLENVICRTGFANLTWKNCILVVIACVFLHLAIAKKMEPLFLIPIASGMFLVNLFPDIAAEGGLLHGICLQNIWNILPPLVFFGIGVRTDFGPLIASPKNFLLGAVAQLGVYLAFFLAVMLGFGGSEAMAVSMGAGADGLSSVYLAGRLGTDSVHMGVTTLAAYLSMVFLPLIQPPVMRLFTNKAQRQIHMPQVRPVTKLERMCFPVFMALLVILVLPQTAPLIGMLMIGNLLRESELAGDMTVTFGNFVLYISAFALGLSVGAAADADTVFRFRTAQLILIGFAGLIFGTAVGILFAKILNKVTHGKVNPLIGSAAVSAFPVSACVAQRVGEESDPTNDTLQVHAIGANAAGMISTIVAAGAFLAIFGI